MAPEMQAEESRQKHSEFTARFGQEKIAVQPATRGEHKAMDDAVRRYGQDGARASVVLFYLKRGEGDKALELYRKLPEKEREGVLRSFDKLCRQMKPEGEMGKAALDFRLKASLESPEAKKLGDATVREALIRNIAGAGKIEIGGEAKQSEEYVRRAMKARLEAAKSDEQGHKVMDSVQAGDYRGATEVLSSFKAGEIGPALKAFYQISAKEKTDPKLIEKFEGELASRLAQAVFIGDGKSDFADAALAGMPSSARERVLAEMDRIAMREMPDNQAIQSFFRNVEKKRDAMLDRVTIDITSNIKNGDFHSAMETFRLLSESEKRDVLERFDKEAKGLKGDEARKAAFFRIVGTQDTYKMPFNRTELSGILKEAKEKGYETAMSDIDEKVLRHGLKQA